MNDLLVSLSAAGGVIVGALLGAATWMIQGIKDWKSALLHAVIAFLALFLADLLVIGPVSALELDKLTPAAQSAIQRWNLGLNRTVVFLMVLPFVAWGFRNPPSRNETVSLLVKRTASRRHEDPERQADLSRIYNRRIDRAWYVGWLLFLIVAYVWGPNLPEVDPKVVLNSLAERFGGVKPMDVKMFFSGIVGATLTIAVQSWREWARRRRMAKACRRLLERELQMLWFDLTGMVRPESSGFFSRQTEIWDTYKAQLPDLLGIRELERVAGAYYWVKDFQYRATHKTVIDYFEETDRVRKAVVEAIQVLGGVTPPTDGQATLPKEAPETSKGGSDR